MEVALVAVEQEVAPVEVAVAGEEGKSASNVDSLGIGRETVRTPVAKVAAVLVDLGKPTETWTRSPAPCRIEE